MADDAALGKRLLRDFLAMHLIAWCIGVLMKERLTEAGLLFQLVVWVVVPIWLMRRVERGSAVARYVFAMMLVFGTIGNAFAALSWALIVVKEGQDWGMFLVSVMIAAGYAVGAMVIGFSPAVHRVVVIGRDRRNKSRIAKFASDSNNADPQSQDTAQST